MIVKEAIAAGNTILEAQENARTLLGAGELDDVKFEIQYAGSKGILGLFSKPAKVRAYIEVQDEPAKPRQEKRERPQRQERKPQQSAKSADEVCEKKDSDKPIESAEAQHTPSQSKNRRNRNRKKKSSHQRPTEAELAKAIAENSKPRSVVIPEAELKMERREVAEGEDMSFDFINTVIRDIGLSATAELYSCDDGTRRITISGEDASTLIGHHGDTLDALQYLANLACAKKNSKGERDKSRVTLDIEGYRAKRELTLRALARRMAEKALRNKRSVMLEPMSAYERRIIHSEIQGIEGVSTNSIGSDNNRKIVIYLTDKKPEGIFEEDKEDDKDELMAAPEQLISHEASDEQVDFDESLSVKDAGKDSDELESEVVAVVVTRPDEDDSEDEALEEDAK